MKELAKQYDPSQVEDRGYITAVPWNAPWGGFFRPTHKKPFS